jgi:hypothetical protein
MRSTFIFIIALLAASASAASTNAPPATNALANALALTAAPAATNAPAGTMAESLISEAYRAKSQGSLLSLELRPNEIKVGRLTLDGVAIELAKADNPLQLLNPFAPPQYGSPEDNVFRSPVDRKVSGLKVFELKF